MKARLEAQAAARVEREKRKAQEFDAKMAEYEAWEAKQIEEAIKQVAMFETEQHADNKKGDEKVDAEDEEAEKLDATTSEAMAVEKEEEEQDEDEEESERDAEDEEHDDGEAEKLDATTSEAMA